MNLKHNKSNDMYIICSSVNSCGERESDEFKTSFKITIKTLRTFSKKIKNCTID